ncbi:MAG TPA: cupin domain-containing protein [Patescibacteria group bacterium]|nr:cupin domain-containing protein [Patescibacteria group bacterium]
MSRPAKAPSGEASHRREELEERKALGDRLHMLRIRRQLSLVTVALGTGLSRSFLALLEAGESDVSVSRLLRVAEFYGVWLADLVGTTAPAVEIMRADKATVLSSDDVGRIRLLSAHTVRTVMPFRIDLPPGARIEGGLSHAGEEFVHCVRGTIDLEVVDTVHRLTSGDTASYPGRLPHSYANPGDEEAVLVGATARYG